MTNQSSSAFSTSQPPNAKEEIDNRGHKRRAWVMRTCWKQHVGKMPPGNCNVIYCYMGYQNPTKVDSIQFKFIQSDSVVDVVTATCEQGLELRRGSPSRPGKSNNSPLVHTPWKTNGWNLQITHEKKGTWSEPNLQGIMFHVNLQIQGCKQLEFYEGWFQNLNDAGQPVVRYSTPPYNHYDCRLHDFLHKSTNQAPRSSAFLEAHTNHTDHLGGWLHAWGQRIHIYCIASI